MTNRKNKQWKKSYEKDIENEKLKILCSFSQPQNELTQFGENDKYTLFDEYAASKMRKLSSLLDKDQIDFLKFEKTCCIQNAKKQRCCAKFHSF